MRQHNDTTNSEEIMMELFNKEDVYDNEISPLVKKIIAICEEHKMPMLASFTYCSDGGSGAWRSTTLINYFDGRVDGGLYHAKRSLCSAENVHDINPSCNKYMLAIAEGGDYETEYAGRTHTLCMYCDADLDEKDHDDDCLVLQARADIESARSDKK